MFAANPNPNDYRKARPTHFANLTDNLACGQPSMQTCACNCACNIAGCDAGNPNIECAHLKSSENEGYIQQRNTEELQNLNQYCVENVWFKVDFGGCPYGIFSAVCPVEPLHAVENGLITTC